MAFLAPLINEQQEDVNGKPLSGGKIHVYLAGTSTPATTYSDKAGLVPNTNPIVLNSLGTNVQGAVWLTGGAAYKFVISDASGTIQRTIDNISGINDTAVTADQWVVFQGVPTFVSATTFTLPGDQTQTFVFGTRVRTVNTGGIVIGTVVRSVFSGSTTVTILPDGGALDAGLSLVSVGLITATNPSLPGTLTTPPWRNRITNPFFRFDKRFQGTVATISFGGTGTYVMDRHYVSCGGANVTAQRVAGTGYQYAFSIFGAASVTSTLFGQRIQGSYSRKWANSQVNVQLPISAVGISTVTWNAYVADVADVFSAKTLVATGTLALTSAVETKFFSFNAGANAARGVAIEFVTGALTAGQSITFQGAYQAEAGQVSVLEDIDPEEDELRCLKFYNTSYQGTKPGTAATVTGRILTASSSTSSYALFQLWFSPVMRATPTVTAFNPTSGASASIRNESAGTDFVAIGFGAPFAGPNYASIQTSTAPPASATMSMHYTADAEL